MPKSDYDTLSEKGNQEYIHPRFGHVSQNRLREIVKSKNQDMDIKKKGAELKKPDDSQGARVLNKRLVAIEQLSSGRNDLRVGLEKINPERARGASNKEALPRIEKVHSEPSTEAPSHH